MIARIGRIVLFFAFLALLFIGGNIRAQKIAEFELALTLTDTEAHGQVDLLANRDIGYDTAATDALDAAFGETYFPGGSGPGVNDFYFTLPDTDQDISAIDIRHKPATDSFALNYKMSMSLDVNTGSLFWDPSQIPAAVTGVWIRPYYSQTPIIDMKNNRIFTFNSDSLITWGPYLVVTVFYNMQPRYLPQSGVEGAQANSGGLIANASVFPNPMPNLGVLDLTMNEPAYISISGYDAAGREVIHIDRSVLSGVNRIGLSGLADARGAIFLRVDAQSGARSEVKNLVVMKE